VTRRSQLIKLKCWVCQGTPRSRRQAMRRSLFDLKIGEAFGRYELLVPVAEGGMSQVWAARLRGTRGFRKLVAIKTLIADCEQSRLERMLLAEARLASQIQHPNVAQYLDLGERDGVLFVVMEWIDGEPLASLMRDATRLGGIPLAIGVQIVAQVCRGLHAAHELHDDDGEPLGLVHCDVSPPNLMISTLGSVKLIDFGISKATRGAPRVSRDAIVAGKLGFMAPEQARGERFDRRADLFSLGIVLYLVATGRHPFGEGPPTERLNRIVHAAPILPPSCANPQIPTALERVMLRALAHDRAARYQSAAEFLCGLRAAMPELAHEFVVGEFVECVCADSIAARRALIGNALRVAGEWEDAAAERTLESVPPAGPVRKVEDPTLQFTPTEAPSFSDIAVVPSVRPRRIRWWSVAVLSACLGLVASVLHLSRSLHAPALPPSTDAAAVYLPVSPYSRPAPNHGAAGSSSPLPEPPPAASGVAPSQEPTAAPVTPKLNARCAGSGRCAPQRRAKARAVPDYGI
jgi:tRNA A-37 threonylcarbamoyl transferase component Bud32